MIVYKCKMCNGNLDMSEPKRLVKCNYCDTFQSVPSVIDETKAEMVNRANRYRQNGEFDRAVSIYEQILKDDATDPEMHWSIVLCKFGVEYVEDPATKRMVPTINRTQSHSILQDSDYQNALAIAGPDVKQYYMEEADKIDTIQRSIWRIAKDSEDYDVFISYKELGSDGLRTKSSTIAQSLYEGLTAAGIKTFFSRVSLADKIGSEFEPYIFSALNSAYVMLVLGTNRDEFIAPWVKNEWSRFRKLTITNSGKKLIPCVLDATMDDLPDELQPYQAQDLNKEGYEQELLDIVKDLVAKLKAGKSALNESDAEKLMKNGETYIVLKDFGTAEMIFRDLCDREPEDYRVWWGRIRSVTKDLSDADAGKSHSQDLKIWMDFLKKLAPAAKYSELLEKYALYLKKVSKQSVFDEIENIKKIREQAIEKGKALENMMQDPTSSDNNLVAFCNEMEASINEAEEQLNVLYAQREHYNNMSGMFFTTCFILFGLSFIPLFFDVLWPIILTTILLIPGSGAAGYYHFRAELLDPQIVKYEGTKEEDESKLNKAQVSLEKGKENLEKKRGYIQDTIQKCHDVVENADRYLTYNTEEISNLLFAILCSEIGEDTPMDQELFRIRQKTFQPIA